MKDIYSLHHTHTENINGELLKLSWNSTPFQFNIILEVLTSGIKGRVGDRVCKWYDCIVYAEIPKTSKGELLE